MERNLHMFGNLESLQADFPGFVIWGETIRGRVTYVAQALDGDTNPRVVTSSSLDRLRSRLEEPVVASDPAKPNIARIYDYLLGGTANFPADRDEAARLLAADPQLAELARCNRAFLTRAVTYVAGQGVRQFIDVGAGLPTSPSTHETAETALPGPRVAYVDNDPVVVSHTRGLRPRSARVVALPGDLRDPAAILQDPVLTSLIDLAEPVCVLLAGRPALPGHPQRPPRDRDVHRGHGSRAATWSCPSARRRPTGSPTCAAPARRPGCITTAGPASRASSPACTCCRPASPTPAPGPAHPACPAPGVPGPDDAAGETTVLCGVARKLRRDRERQAEAALGVGPPFP